MKLQFGLLVVQALSLSCTTAKFMRKKTKKFNKECTAIIGDKYPNGRFLQCLTPDGMIYKVDGINDDFIVDNFDNGPFLSGQTKLVFSDKPIVKKFTGTIVSTSLPTLQESTSNRVAGMQVSASNRVAGRSTTNTRTVLVVRVIAKDRSTSFSEAALSDKVFGMNGDSVNLKSIYASCSHNALNFEPAQRSGITNGVVTVSVKKIKTKKGDTKMNNAITSELNRMFGVSSPSQLADHVMYCLPPNTMRGIAYAYINNWLSVYNDDWCTYPSSGVHELGHNLGLLHSGKGNDVYGDTSAMMGYSYASDDAPNMCFNAAKSWQLGFYPQKRVVVQADGPRSYMGELAGFVEDPNDNSIPPMLVKLNTKSSTDFYLSFNKKAGFNSDTQIGGDQVLITIQGGEGLYPAESSLLALLGAGQSWTSGKVFDGEQVKVEVVSIGLRAEVNICIGSCPTSAHPSKAPSVSPSSTPSASPITAPSGMPTSSVVPSLKPSTPLPTLTAMPSSKETASPTARPSISPTVSPTKKPTASPTASPTAHPTASPTGSCSDSPLTFQAKVDKKKLNLNCATVATNPSRYCSAVGVAATCPSACNKCDLCTDSPLKFGILLKNKLKFNKCKNAQKKPEKMCIIAGVDLTCQRSCGSCV